MTEAEEKVLLEDLRNYLDITWEDAGGDKKLSGMLKRGMAAISGKTGGCDFVNETQEKSLLFIYVMYERAGELARFWENYRPEIISLQIARKVDAYAEGETGDI